MPKYQFHQSKYISSVQFSCSVMSDSLWPHGLQHTRPPCPSPAPGIYSNTCPLNPWCHPTISSSVIRFSSCLQSFPASGSFQMSQFFSSGGQSIRVSASASVLPMNIQDRFPLGWTGWISSPRGSEESFPTPQFKYIRYWKKIGEILVSPCRSEQSLCPHRYKLFPASPTSTSNLLELGSPPLRQLTQNESEKLLSCVRLCATPWTVQSM